MSIYNADGKINVTQVTGSSWTGLYAANGTINVVVDDASHFGVYHPCGAYRINSSFSGLTYYDSTGAVYANRLFGPGIDPTDLIPAVPGGPGVLIGILGLTYAA